MRVSLLAALLIAVPLGAQSGYVPPVPIGIKTGANVRAPKPLAFPPEKSHWIRIRSAHFDVMSSADAQRTQAIVSDLETLATVLTRANPRFQAPSDPTRVFVFSTRAESDAWFDLLFGPGPHRVGGAYIRHGTGGTMVIDGANARRIPRTAKHELIHDLLRQGELVPPLWVEEGLAEYFSIARIEQHRVDAGLTMRMHALRLENERPLLSLQTLFGIQPETPAATSGLFYAMSWAAVDWLMQLDSTVFYAFLRDLERGAPVADALSVRYRKSLEDLASAIRRRGKLTGTTVRFQSDAPVAAPAASELDRATLLYELGRFLSIIAGAEQEASRHFDEALRIDPKHARTLSILGRHEEAIAAVPDDPTVLLAYAESLMKTATGSFAGVFDVGEADADRFRKARTFAERAHAIDPSSARALGDLGTSYLVEDDLRDGIANLERAVALAPRRSDFALNLYGMYLRSGEREKADALFASLTRVRDTQVLFAARNIRLSVEVDLANELAREGKLDEAAARVRALAAATEDAKARRDLEMQAEKLEETAMVNRHIQMYNDAVTFANSNHNDDALKLLDAILKDATDPLVIADAKRLRDELRKSR